MFAADKLLFAASLILIPACDPDDLAAEPDGQVQYRCTPPDCFPPIGNTEWMGSLEPLSPLDTQWNEYQGIRVQGLVLFGSVLATGFGATEGQLWATADGPNGKVVYTGHDLDNAIFVLSINTELKYLTINSVTAPVAPDTHWRYELFWDDDGPGPLGHGPACIPDAENAEVWAVAHDSFDVDTETGDVFARANTVYFGCASGALGKAPLAARGYGFRPFEIGLARFELVLRVILADYCFDGKSWTHDGTMIHYDDKWNIGSVGGGTTTDAVWATNGALCIGSNPRVYEYDHIECPGSPKPPLCGTAAAAATLYNGSQGVFWTRNP